MPSFRTKAARRRLDPGHGDYLDPNLVSSYRKGQREDYKARRRLDPGHTLYLDPSLRSSYKKESSYLAHRESVFRNRRNSFIRDNRLGLHPHYNDELSHPHWYPDRNARSPHGKLVQYLSPDQRTQTVKSMTGGQVADDSLYSLSGGKSTNNNRGVIFTRRGSVDHLMMMQKEEVAPTAALDPDHLSSDMFINKTNHSSFNRGQNVANAGFLSFNNSGQLQNVTLSSGHYAPGPDSGVALAMWADQTGAFDSSSVPIMMPGRGHHAPSTQVDVSRERRVSAVNRWAQNH